MEIEDSSQELFAAVQIFSNQVSLIKEMNLNIDEETDNSSTLSIPQKEPKKLYFFFSNSIDSYIFADIHSMIK